MKDDKEEPISLILLADEIFKVIEAHEKQYEISIKGAHALSGKIAAMIGRRVDRNEGRG